MEPAELDDTSKALLGWYGNQHDESGRESLVGSDSPAQLQWRGISAWCIESVCGRYRIEKFAPVEDVLADACHGHKYRCLRFTSSGWFWQFDTREDPQQARNACEIDLTVSHT